MKTPRPWYGKRADTHGFPKAATLLHTRHSGASCAFFTSGITNKNSDNGEVQTNHEEVLEAANIIGPKIITILKEILPKL